MEFGAPVWGPLFVECVGSPMRNVERKDMPVNPFDPWEQLPLPGCGLDAITKRVKSLTVRERIKKAYTGPKLDPKGFFGFCR